MAPTRVRVVVTGLGAITSVGQSSKETWRNLVSGRSGIQSGSELFDVDGLPVRIASEVRSLAEHSQAAATEIISLVNSGVSLAENAGERLKQLVPDIQKTAELVQEISAASKEQNTGTNQINRAIQQLDNITQQNSATSEALSATAEELSSQAGMLQQTIAFFRLDETVQSIANEDEYIQQVENNNRKTAVSPFTMTALSGQVGAQKCHEATDECTRTREFLTRPCIFRDKVLRHVYCRTGCQFGLQSRS